MITFHFISLFPKAIEVWMETSIIGRAKEKGLFDSQYYCLRDYSENSYGSVDDQSYGGGGGMVLGVAPLAAAVESIWDKVGRSHCKCIYFSPAGKPLNRELVDQLNQSTTSTPHLILVCGHYEGVDQRFVDHWVDEEISLGDFVLTGGEIPAVALADALIRQQTGVLGYNEAPKEESFSLEDANTKSPLLEYPQYTRPATFRGIDVPQILLSGDHSKISKWRHEQSVERTQIKRPDLRP